MKKVKLSLMAVIATSVFAVAGGDIAPVEPEVNIPTEETSAFAGNFYLGAGYGYETVEADALGVSTDENYDTVVLQAGYKFNEYIAAEARYWIDTESDGADTWGIYAKPMYPVTTEVDVYALLGYAEVDADGFDGGFSWGLGASYAINDNVSVFADYVSMYDDTMTILGTDVDTTVDTVNVGVTYNF